MSQGWSDEELKASVDAYRVMLEKQNAQKKFVKAHVYRELALRFGREEGAFERRMQNISSIYQESGFNWVQGLKPQKNIGSVIKPRLVEMIGLRAESNLVDHELDKAETDAEQDRAFSPLDVEDARARVVTSIIRRRGQPAFRKKYWLHTTIAAPSLTASRFRSWRLHISTHTKVYTLTQLPMGYCFVLICILCLICT